MATLASLSNQASLLSELWNILPYAGTWTATGCGVIDNFRKPLEETTQLVGIPYSVKATGVNKELRLMMFGASSMLGPIDSIGTKGVQPTFLSNNLNHLVTWNVQSIDGKKICKAINVGFYTSNYLSAGSGKLIPMISTVGPTFYRAKTSGQFEVTSYNSFYVIVDANVSIELCITYSYPKPLVVPCLNELFIEYPYYVYKGRSKVEELAAIDQLLEIRTLTTLYRPVDKYVKLSLEMIRYLNSVAVTVSIFDDTVAKPCCYVAVSIKASANPPANVPCQPFSRNSRDKDVYIVYQMNTNGRPDGTCEGPEGYNRAIKPESQTAAETTIRHGVRVSMPSLNLREPTYKSYFTSEPGKYAASFFKNTNDMRPPIFARDLGPNKTFELLPYGYKVEGWLDNIGFNLIETREYVSAPPFDLVPSYATIEILELEVTYT